VREAGHPERPERAAAVAAAARALGWAERAAPAADDAQLAAVHGREYVERVVAGAPPVELDAARHAAGGACLLVDAVLGGTATTGIAALRPPGHHADTTEPMGFCVFNNVAVAAGHALDAGIERVLIVDWDVHHGNGTHALFRRSDRVLYASLHEAGLWPGTGELLDSGAEEGRGYAINVPIPPLSDPEVWLSVVEHVVVPAAADFAPGLVLVSAGFDAHRADPLADSLLEPAHFAELARQVASLDAPVALVLEGGYDVEALGASAAATLEALDRAEAPGSVAPDPVVTPRVAARVAEFWSL
jgi:acetoin utilization deacetylase AcuC-like enzyme